jgi:hypothetical protein
MLLAGDEEANDDDDGEAIKINDDSSSLIEGGRSFILGFV